MKNWKVGDIFIYRSSGSINQDVDGSIGVVLKRKTRHGQYECVVAHKRVWLVDCHMEPL